MDLLIDAERGGGDNFYLISDKFVQSAVQLGDYLDGSISWAPLPLATCK